MQRMIKKALFALCSFSIAFNFLQATTFEDHKKAKMIEDLEIIKHHFEMAYAPAEWKKEYAGWDLNEAFERSKNQVLTTPSITTKQFQEIVRDFTKSMKDYHVGVMFFSTEFASLPFSVKGVEGRYFIKWVDPLRLPAAYYGIRPGDELLEFDDQPIVEVIANLAKFNGKSSNQSTDQGLAEMKLTIRAGMAGDRVPKGPIHITTRSAKTGKVNTHQLRWSYTPEHVKNHLDVLQACNCISFLFPDPKKSKVELPRITMANPLHQAFAEKCVDRKGGLGSRKSFLPLFGEVIWSNESDLKKDEEIPFWFAYIYQHPQGHKIGYIRIPHYLASLLDVKEFGKILGMMEEQTDALVIDQLHNFGGFVHIQYELASILTHQPLQAPLHRIKITQKDVFEAYLILESIKFFEMMLEAREKEDSHPKSDKENEEEEQKDNEEGEEDEEEQEFDFQKILFLKAHYEHILEEWNNGRTLTRPTPIEGVDKINPHPKYQYSKPILMLIDEMDFSGGDFIPAILQDNKRAVLFGSRTAGAGGYVSGFQFPNNHGIAFCSYTASIAERTDSKKIEDLGVSPDIPYQITLEDVQNGYQGYIEAVNQSVESLLKNSTE